MPSVIVTVARCRHASSVASVLVALAVRDLAAEVLRHVVLGRRDLDDRVVAVVVLEAQRNRDHRVHRVHHRDVGELEDLPRRSSASCSASNTASSTRPKLCTSASVYASSVRSSGENWSEMLQALSASIFSSENPSARHDLQCCENTNWLPTSQPARVWPSSRSSGAELALGAGVEAEAAARVLEHVRRVGEHRPPVAGGAGRGSGLGHRITVAEEALVHREDDRRLGVGPWDLLESWHRGIVYGTSTRLGKRSRDVATLIPPGNWCAMQRVDGEDPPWPRAGSTPTPSSSSAASTTSRSCVATWPKPSSGTRTSSA